MPTFLTTFLLLLLLSCCASTASSSKEKVKNIFILAGQSNMAGRGGVVNETWDGVVPPESEANPNTLSITNDLMWEEAHEPLHEEYDIHETSGIGPGMVFANALLKEHQSLPPVIGLVSCAIGNTVIAQWAKGEKFYNATVKRTLAALQHGGILRALLWYQGESDSFHKETAELYKQRLELEILHRCTCRPEGSNATHNSALASGGRYKEEVRQAQKSVKLPNVSIVDAEGLQLMLDNLHLTSESAVKVGFMLAEAFQQFKYEDVEVHSVETFGGFSVV